jgi:hypothetical protein
VPGQDATQTRRKWLVEWPKRSGLWALAIVAIGLVSGADWRNPMTTVGVAVSALLTGALSVVFWKDEN